MRCKPIKDHELRQLVASLAISHRETEQLIQKLSRDADKRHAEMSKKADERHADTESQLLEISKKADERHAEMLEISKKADERHAETERQIKETDLKFQELADKRNAETNKRFRETDKQIKELGKQIGGVGKKIGSFTEGLALPSMTKILTQKFGMTHISPSTRVKDKQGNEHEIDVLAYANGEINTAFIVEVKSHLREEAIEQILKQLANFPILFPELADKKLYGILAAVDANQHLQNQVLKEGLYFAKIHDEQFSLCVPKDFKPICFNPKL